MLYAGRVYLQYTEEEFWSLTPRKFLSQLIVHSKMQEAKYGSKKSESAPVNSYIDKIPGW